MFHRICRLISFHVKMWKPDQIPACDICQQPRNMRVEWDNWVRDKRGFQHIGCVALYQLWFKVRFRINNPMERAAMWLNSRNLAKYSRCPWNILMMTIHFPTKYDYWTFVYNIFNRHYLLCVINSFYSLQPFDFKPIYTAVRNNQIVAI